MGYAQERVQFGKPISSFQAVRFMLAEMMTQVEAARSLVYKAVTHVESGLDDAEKLSAMAKSYASDMAMRVTTRLRSQHPLKPSSRSALTTTSMATVSGSSDCPSSFV
jgi:alkylation response protein AidB-like acyl-CoA dehydrogenase